MLQKTPLGVLPPVVTLLHTGVTADCNQQCREAQLFCQMIFFSDCPAEAHKFATTVLGLFASMCETLTAPCATIICATCCSMLMRMCFAQIAFAATALCASLATLFILTVSGGLEHVAEFVPAALFVLLPGLLLLPFNLLHR